MQIKTVIRDRGHYKKIKTKRDLIIFTILYISEVVLNTFLPFVAGFYFCQTQNLFWLLLFLILIIMNLKIEYRKDVIKIKILRDL